MAQPADIVNGETPNAERLQSWFDYLNGGKGIASGTFDALKAAAVVGDFQIAYATDIDQLVFYNAKSPANSDANWRMITG